MSGPVTAGVMGMPPVSNLLREIAAPLWAAGTVCFGANSGVAASACLFPEQIRKQISSFSNKLYVIVLQVG